MSSTFIYHRHGNPCPVCGGTKTQCRTTTTDDGRRKTHCRGKVDAPAGWGYIGEDKHGFPQFIEGWDDRRERDCAAIARAKAEREAHEAQRLRRAALTVHRDEAYRAWQPYQRLSQSHRQQLRDRGLTADQIDTAESLGWLRTWTNGVRLSAPKKGIPGQTWDGTLRSAMGADGLAIAAPNWKGQIAGFQVRPDDPQIREETAKYLSLPGQHLKNGEQPMPVFTNPDGHTGPVTIVVTEGHLKAMVTGFRYWGDRPDLVMVGANGSNWAGSPAQWKKLIEHFTPQGIAAIELWPDAGARSNPAIVESANALAALLKSLGHTLKVRWWGQWEKEGKGVMDPDEAPPEMIWAGDLLTVDQFAGDAIAQLPTITPAETVMVPRDGQAQAVMHLIGTHRHIWNRGGTGSGKSRSAAVIAREFLAQNPNGRVLYVTARPDGISDPAVADTFARMVVRTPENCTKPHLFNGLGDKGYGEVKGEAKLNPICMGCKAAAACTKAAGYFRHDRRTFLEENRAIALHPQSLSPGLFEDSEGNRIPVLPIWEEAGRLAPLVESLAFGLRDFDRAMGDLEADHPELYAALAPLRAVLRPLLKSEGLGYYGIDTVALKERLGTLTVTPEMLEAARGYETALSQQLAAALAEEADAVEISKVAAGKGAKRQLHRLNAALEHRQTREKESAIEDAIARWLVMLLQAIADDQSAITVDRWGKCTISRPNRRLIELAGLAVSNIYLDATADPAHLGAVFGFGDGDFATIDVEPIGPGATVKVTQITGLGKCGAQRSDELQQRIEGAIAALNPDGDAAVFDLKKFSTEANPETGEKVLREDRGGYWFVHTRGSNEYQTTKRIISVGCACPSLHALKADYVGLTGLKPEGKAFERYVQERIWAELRQLRGRLREMLRPGEVLELILITDATMPPDWAVEVVPVATIDPSLAPKGDATRSSILGSLWSAIAAGESLPKIAAVAANAGVSVGRVSQIAKSLCQKGYRAMVKSLVSLKSQLIEKLNFSDLPPDEQMLAKELQRLGIDIKAGTITPVEGAIAAARLLLRHGESAYLRAIGALPDGLRTLLAQSTAAACQALLQTLVGEEPPPPALAQT